MKKLTITVVCLMFLFACHVSNGQEFSNIVKKEIGERVVVEFDAQRTLQMDEEQILQNMEFRQGQIIGLQNEIAEFQKLLDVIRK